MLKVQKIQDKKIWNTFLNTYSGPFPLFQTWQWGDVQQSLGFEVERVGLYENKKLIGIAQLTFIHARRGTYVHVRQGPVLAKSYDSHFTYFVQEIMKQAKKIQASFVRISPLIEKQAPLILPWNTISSPIHNMDAEICWVLNITKSEENILKEMRKSHRYLIRKAQAMPIKIIKTTAKKDLQKFLPLYKTLAQKKHFIAHKGLQEELEVFSKENMSLLFLAQYEGKIITGALIDFVGNMAIYRHSASDDNFRQIPAMYLLQWEVIKEAKKRGLKEYNFWGIAQNDSKSHPWYGLTLFKTGFGGEKREYIHAHDIILSPWYVKTFFIDYLMKLKKGY